MEGKQSLVLRGALAGVFAALIASGLYFTGIFESLEYQLYDADFRMNAKGEAPAEIVIVAIDEPSLKRLGSWPWPRAYHAEVLRQIRARGAKVIGMDIGFYEPDRIEPMNDQELAAATREAGNVVLPVILEKFTRDGVEMIKVMENLPEVTEAAAGVGHAHIESSADGIARKVHLAYRTGGETYWGMSLEILKRYLGLPDAALRELRPGVLGVGEIEIPVNADPHSGAPGEGRIAIDYEMHIAFAGDRETFRSIPAHEVIAGNLPPDYFAGKIVLYGGKAAGLYDDHMTPFSQERAPMAGVEIQANVIDA
ncbi:MAG TPA: CHASE2 domain-containing protein, partial [Vicinamibacteria bacterium]